MPVEVPAGVSELPGKRISPGWMLHQRQCRCGCGRWYRPARRNSARILDMCTPVFLSTILSISSWALNLSQYSNPPPLVHISTAIFSTQTGNSASLQPRHPSMSGSQASSPVDHRRLASAHPRIKLLNDECILFIRESWWYVSVTGR